MPASITVEPIRALNDNYIWMIREGNQAVVVDPGVAAPVVQHLEQLGLKLAAILLTHHHYDHNLGVPDLLLRWPGIPVYGPLLNGHDLVSHPPFPKPGTVPLDCATDIVIEGDVIELDGTSAKLKVLAVPGHTKGHVVFHEPELGWLFSGDTLFGGGCGKVFGGSMSEMADSLYRLAALPGQTQVYCAHEYTLSNLRFALAVEPDNEATAARYEADSAKRALDLPTIPTTIEVERATNPFLRVTEPGVLSALSLHRGVHPTARGAAFKELREWKNEFKG